MWPNFTASIAGPASSSMSMNHCSEMSGSTRSPERWLNGTAWTYSSRARIAPSASRSATTRACAPATVSPA